MKKVLLIILLSISAFSIQAQDAPVFILQGTITNLDTKEPLERATIELKIDDKIVAELQTDEEGFYCFYKKPGRVIIDGKKVKKLYILANTTYLITVTHKDYNQIQGYVSTKGINESKTFVRDFKIQYYTKKQRLYNNQTILKY